MRRSEQLLALLDFVAAPLCPELRVFAARDLTEIWEAAERIAGEPVPSPFWAYPWAGGAALARAVLDHPEWVRGRAVLDLGCGGGIAALAAARCGATRVVANDVDPMALAMTALAAERQHLELELRLGDLTASDAGAGTGARAQGADRRHRGLQRLAADAVPVEMHAPDDGAPVAEPDAFDVVLCGDVAYERSVAPRIRAFLARRAAAGALVLVADPGRAYFDLEGLEEIGRWTIAVPRDLEGVNERTAAAYRLR